MADLETFRSETAAWLDANAPEFAKTPFKDTDDLCWGGAKYEFAESGEKEWLDRMAAKGWTAPAWPVKYGGGGLNKAEEKILAEEMRKRRLRPPLVGFGLSMIGMLLLQEGSEELCAEHLPKIIRGEIRWCQGYSEPGSGSDLASLRTRAVRDGDDFVLNGQKVWTSYADKADWMFILVRTDPDASKHTGISFLLMDMASPGVEAKPIALISGYSPFCETFLTDVRVPAGNLVGTENDGWRLAKALLGHERTMIAGFGAGSGGSGGKRESMPDRAKRYSGEQDGQLADSILRDRIAAGEMDQRAFELTMLRSRDSMKAGHKPGAETSFFKLHGTEINMRRNELEMQIAGPQSLGWEGEGFDERELAAARAWLRSRGNSIEGGTSEVQLNIIAKRVLGLPD
jgi:alkylation response protein AidB-like acyl-CoA dehydrogenase